MTPQEALAAELKGLEEALLETTVRKSARLTELLDDDFVEFASSGHVYTKVTLSKPFRRRYRLSRRRRSSSSLSWHRMLRS